MTTEAAVVAVWKDVLGVNCIGPDDNFFELGGHSLLVIHMAQQLRSRHKLIVPLEHFLADPTVAGLVRALTGAAPDHKPAVLTPMRTDGTRPPFFAVHPIGGGCFIYRHLMERLGPDQPFYGLQADGLAEIGERGDPYSSLEEMAASYVAAIRTVQPIGPYYLGGLSWGGLLAFEMAHQLTEASQEVRLVALLDTPAPEELCKLEALDDVSILVGLARDLGFQKGIELPVTAEQLRPLTRHDQIARVLDELKSAGLMPADIPVSWMDRQLQGYRSRLRFVRNYTPRVYEGRLTFFRAAVLDAETVRHLEVAGFDYHDLTLGWDRLSSEPIDVHIVPGNHSEIVFEPNVGILAGYLSNCITQSTPSKDGACHENRIASVSPV